MKNAAITIIQSALEGIGAYQPGETISDADVERSLKELNKMIEQWSNSTLACFAFLTQSVVLQSNKSIYTIGPVTAGYPTPDIIGTRPLKLEQVYMQDSQGNKYYVRLDTLTDFNNITNLLITSTLPTDIYYDPQVPIANIKVWPTPVNPIYTLFWTSFQKLVRFPDTEQEIEFPEGYEDAICSNLMVKLCKFFGKMVTPDIRMEADEARGVIKRKNAIAQISYYDPELNQRQGKFNVYTSGFGNRGP